MANYIKIGDSGSGQSYRSWIQLEQEAEKVLERLNEYTELLLICDGEPDRTNVLFIDQSD